MVHTCKRRILTYSLVHTPAGKCKAQIQGHAWQAAVPRVTVQAWGIKGDHRRVHFEWGIQVNYWPCSQYDRLVRHVRTDGKILKGNVGMINYKYH